MSWIAKGETETNSEQETFKPIGWEISQCARVCLACVYPQCPALSSADLGESTAVLSALILITAELKGAVVTLTRRNVRLVGEKNSLIRIRVRVNFTERA